MRLSIYQIQSVEQSQDLLHHKNDQEAFIQEAFLISKNNEKDFEEDCLQNDQNNEQDTKKTISHPSNSFYFFHFDYFIS
jgi:hypothetical protein